MERLKKKPIEHYRNIHRGNPVAVLGGGPNVIDDIKLLPEETILISVNHHAQKVIDCNYMVFLDNPDNCKPLLDGIVDFGGIRITPGYCEKYGDIDIVGNEFQPCPISAIYALCFAEYTGAGPVILCGFDMYQNKKQSHVGMVPSDNYVSKHKDTLEYYLSHWRKYVATNKDNIYAVSGPLVKERVFKEWTK